MRIAMPLFGEAIAPRFCGADQVRLVDLVDGNEVSRVELAFEVDSVPGRLAMLHGLGVKALLCGGINRLFLPLAAGWGITVYWGLSGAADDALALFLGGSMECATAGNHPGGGRGAGRGRGQRCHRARPSSGRSRN